MPRPLFRNMNNRRMNNTNEKTIVIHDFIRDKSLFINVNPFNTITQFIEKFIPIISRYFNIELEQLELVITYHYDSNKQSSFTYNTRSETRLYHIFGQELQLNKFHVSIKT